MKKLFSFILCSLAAISSAEISVAISNNGDDLDGAVLINGQLGRLVGYGDYGMLTYRDSKLDDFFGTLQANKINMTRVWLHYVWTQDLTPFRKHKDRAGNMVYHVGDPARGVFNKIDNVKYEDSKMKYDPNARLYERLAHFVEEANEHGIVVQLCLFDANQLEDDPGGLRWDRYFYNHENNLASFLQRSSDFYTSRASLRLCDDIVDRVMGSIGNMPNVIYEVMNEPDVAESPWNSAKQAFHKRVITRLRNNMKLTTGSTVISVNPGSGSVTWAHDYNEVDMLSIHLSEKTKSSFDANDAWQKVIPRGRSQYWLKPLIVSNDGNLSQTVLRGTRSAPQSASNEATRATFTGTLLNNLFGLGNEPNGMLHFEFLDKDLMKKSAGALRSWEGTTWQTGTYKPNGLFASAAILGHLSNYAFTPSRPQ